MKTLSVATIKGIYRYRSKEPKEGSKLRELYDLFMNNKGKIIKIKLSRNRPSEIEQLRNTYDMDIRSLKRGYWCFVGEWFGKVYIDYLVGNR